MLSSQPILHDMTDVLFYHLERATPAQVLPGLLERTLARNWTAVIRCAGESQVKDLDEHLWTYHEESFLPHGTGSPDPETPVWLTASYELPSGRDVLFALTAEGFQPDSLAGLTRAVLMFTDDQAPDARMAWKAVKASNLESTYWKQDPSGKWIKAA